MNYQAISYAVDDRVATITFNRPERLNAFGQQIRAEFPDAIGRADQDPEVRVIIVTGAGGRAFSTGYDQKESAQTDKNKSVEEWRRRMDSAYQFTRHVMDCSKPTIAVIEGYCLAGAMELAQMCDIRVFPKAELARETLKIAKRMSRVALSCLQWNKRALRETFEIMGQRAALHYGVEAAAIMDAQSSPEYDRFDEIRRTEGLSKANQWRDAQFKPFE